ncbi:MAG: hypothetical protein BM564_07220 [Bacteroidetes bacterium MedPE-SWsnd-G2]|nr:MAG: hypothetical protein BM564_07220 [Bacteroidetes bacterium MedPE-SWsnd-G2]
MFLKGFKDKSNQKFIVKNGGLRDVNVHSKSITKLAIVAQESELNAVEELKSYVLKLGLSNLKISSLFLVDRKSELLTSEKLTFTEKDLGWSGNIKSEDANAFMKEEYDVLICYCNNNILPLDVVSSKTNANLKVGMTSDRLNIFDVLFGVKTQNLKTFTEELKKYLTVLNKL